MPDLYWRISAPALSIQCHSLRTCTNNKSGTWVCVYNENETGNLLRSHIYFVLSWLDIPRFPVLSSKRLLTAGDYMAIATVLFRDCAGNCKRKRYRCAFHYDFESQSHLWYRNQAVRDLNACVETSTRIANLPFLIYFSFRCAHVKPET